MKKYILTLRHDKKQGMVDKIKHLEDQGFLNNVAFYNVQERLGIACISATEDVILNLDKFLKENHLGFVSPDKERQ